MRTLRIALDIIRHSRPRDLLADAVGAVCLFGGLALLWIIAGVLQ